MKFKVSLVENEANIRKNILDSIKILIDNALESTVLKVKSPISQIIKNALMSEPEYSSLISGQLRLEFGIVDTGNVDIAVTKISESIQIIKRNTKLTNLGISGGLDINIINNQDYGGALTDASAIVTDTEKGYSLPWLEWLLLKGNDIIIRGFDVKYGSNSRSRTGEAIMIKSGSNWRVPPEFAGSIRDNWTTRALNRVDKDILNTIQSTFQSSL